MTDIKPASVALGFLSDNVPIWPLIIFQLENPPEQVSEVIVALNIHPVTANFFSFKHSFPNSVIFLIVFEASLGVG